MNCTVIVATGNPQFRIQMRESKRNASWNAFYRFLADQWRDNGLVCACSIKKKNKNLLWL
jgi:hypothetical protein